MFFRKKTVSICALIAARNEHPYLRILLPVLAEQNIDAVILDNDSTDGSQALYAAHTGAPILAVRHLPHRGVFSLTEQLVAKQHLAERLNYDWVIHQDADEILEHRADGRTLRDAIQEAHDRGHNAINFEEVVFLPGPDEDFAGRNYYQEMRRYYYFAPSPRRLNRAWKVASRLSNLAFGGHRLEGRKVSFAPENHILRHYIALSEQRAMAKYLSRTFADGDLAKGWHGNRVTINRENIRVPTESAYLLELPSGPSKAFRWDRPAPRHYWEW
jgi:hypothetical protein